MLNITIGTNTSRKQVVVAPDTVLRDLLENNGVNTSVGTIHIDGVPMTVAQMGMTLAEIGVSDKAFIISIAKADNA